MKLFFAYQTFFALLACGVAQIFTPLGCVKNWHHSENLFCIAGLPLVSKVFSSGVYQKLSSLRKVFCIAGLWPVAKVFSSGVYQKLASLRKDFCIAGLKPCAKVFSSGVYQNLASLRKQFLIYMGSAFAK